MSSVLAGPNPAEPTLDVAITTVPSADPGAAPRWIKVIDQSRCIGCHACTTACKSENEVPIGVTRTYVKSVEVGVFPEVRRDFQVTRCNQCTDAPCVEACPTAAMFKRGDGIVDFDKSACIGCKACIAACPYDAIFINPEDHSAEKCNFCAHRIDGGLEPACVTVCPTQAIMVGDLNDTTSIVAQIVNRDIVNVRRPEKETRPGLFYKGAHAATLDPLAAQRPPGDSYVWSQKGNDDPQAVESGHPGPWNSSAAALLTYDVPHRAPWDWRVSLYTWTKGISAGAYIVPLLLVLFGVIERDSQLWTLVAPVLGGTFLALTGLLLLLDLEHPERFYFIFTKAQPRSWLVRGAALISLYGAVLGLHLVAGLAAQTDLIMTLAFAGLPLAVGTAVYTAYLFAQSKARDLWQNPLLPAHFVVEALLVGAAIVVPAALWLDTGAVDALAGLIAAAAGLHLLLVAGEATLAHPTAHARLAAHNMIAGKFRSYYWSSVGLVGVGLLAPFMPEPLGVAAAGMAALIGLLAYEHAYVQAGQSVPLA